MSIVSRYGVAALVFTATVAAAGYAVHDREFHAALTGAAGDLATNVATAGHMMSGDLHLDNPGSETISRKTNLDRIESASVVTHVEVIGGGQKQRIVLLNPDGEEVYSHDPASNTTIVAKDAIIPSVTVRDTPDSVAELRVVTAAPSVEAPAALRQALADGADNVGLFYREDL